MRKHLRILSLRESKWINLMRDLKNQKKNCRICKTISRNCKKKFTFYSNNSSKLKLTSRILKIRIRYSKISKSVLKSLSPDSKEPKKDGRIEKSFSNRNSNSSLEIPSCQLHSCHMLVPSHRSTEEHLWRMRFLDKLEISKYPTAKTTISQISLWNQLPS